MSLNVVTENLSILKLARLKSAISGMQRKTFLRVYISATASLNQLE